MSFLSPLDQLRILADEVAAGIKALAAHAGITDLDERDRRRQREARTWGDDAGLVFIRAHPYAWNPLPAEASAAQQRLHERYGRYREVVRLLLRGRVRRVQQELKEADATVGRFIAQERADTGDVASEVKANLAAVNKLLLLVAGAEDPSDRRAVFVPDTNALIHNPQLEHWAFAGTPRFRFVMVPTVLQELDQLKVIGRADGLREKAERVIRQLKEYQRRGPLHAGVPVRSGVSELVAAAVEPDMAATLPWLRETNADDRMIASALEIMRSYPHSPVVFVTRDINAQNKATFAGLPFVEPPDPRPGASTPGS